MPVRPRSSAVGVWTGDEVLVFGGEPVAWCPPAADCGRPEHAPLSDGAAYDPATDTWRRIAEAPVPIPGGARAVVVDGVVHVLVNGSERPGDRRAFLAYRIADDAWEVLPAPDAGRTELATSSGEVVAWARWNDRGVHLDLRFDRATRSWSPLPEDPLAPASERLVVGLDAGFLLFATPRTDDAATTHPVRAAALDPATWGWERRADSSMVGGWDAAVVDGRVVFPQVGTTRLDGPGGRRLELDLGGVYDPSGDRWSPLPGVPTGSVVAGVVGRDGAAVAGLHGEVLLADGRRVRTPFPRHWAAERFDQTVVVLDGAWFVVGGQRWRAGDREGDVLGDGWLWRLPEPAVFERSDARSVPCAGPSPQHLRSGSCPAVVRSRSSRSWPSRRAARTTIRSRRRRPPRRR